jgi:hypothetical protein
MDCLNSPGTSTTRSTATKRRNRISHSPHQFPQILTHRRLQPNITQRRFLQQLYRYRLTTTTSTGSRILNHSHSQVRMNDPHQNLIRPIGIKSRRRGRARRRSMCSTAATQASTTRTVRMQDETCNCGAFTKHLNANPMAIELGILSFAPMHHCWLFIGDASTTISGLTYRRRKNSIGGKKLQDQGFGRWKGSGFKHFRVGYHHLTYKTGRFLTTSNFDSCWIPFAATTSYRLSLIRDGKNENGHS